MFGFRWISEFRRQKAQLSALDKSHAMIEFDMMGTIVAANGNFLNLMACNLHEIQGKHHRIFLDPADRESEDYRSF